jgi:hypothetical protein
MNAHRLPGFTAEASLYKTSLSYRKESVGVFRESAGVITSQLIRVHGCWDCGSAEDPADVPRCCRDFLMAEVRVWASPIPTGLGFSTQQDVIPISPIYLRNDLAARVP